MTDHLFVFVRKCHPSNICHVVCLWMEIREVTQLPDTVHNETDGFSDNELRQGR